MQFATGLMGLISDILRGCARLILGDIWWQCDFLCIKPALMPFLLSISSLTSLQLISELIDTVLHRSNLITEMCDQSFAGFGLVCACSLIRCIIADHLIEPVECGQGSACTEGQALRAPCLYLLSGKR
jgi:hypothetical protein